MSKAKISNMTNNRKRKPLSQLTVTDTGPTKKSKVGQNVSRRAGTINQIILKNFMCHSLMEVDFKESNIYMVIGKNGSGKSAILTALIVGLGGKATLTNRGSNIKGFVKVGKASGSVEIQLCNEGPYAYKPKTYGNSITVIRNLTASGSSSYKVKNASGNIVATQAKEVQNITANLNIQIDNPISLLTQDTARNFLSSNNPKNKFTLFMRATRLEVMNDEYKKIVCNKNSCHEQLNEKKAHYNALQDEIHKLKSKIDSHNSILSLKERKCLLQREMMWSQVKDLEEALAEEQAKMDDFVEKMKDYQRRANMKAEEIKTIEKKISSYDREIKELKEQIDGQKKLQNESLNELNELKIAYKEAKQKRQELVIEIKTKQQNLAYLQTEINNSTENMLKVEKERKERMDKLTSLQAKIKDSNDQLETIRNELFQVIGNINKKKDDEASLNSELSQYEQKLGREMSSLKMIQKESENTLLVYGRNIPRIKELIKQRINSFQQEPKGPLGSYMKLKDKKWAVAVEGYLGVGMLSAFTVDNSRDAKVLQQLFAQCLGDERQPTIITSKFINKKHDVSRHLVRAPPDCISLYDAVLINDPVVSNCIVDQMETEQILLIPSGERAMQLMSERNNVPQNCKQALTIAGDKYYPDPNYRTYASNYNRARFLQVNKKEHIQLLEENISKLKKAKHAVQSQFQALQQDITAQQRKQNEIENMIRKMTAVRENARKQYDNLNSQAEPEVHNLINLESEVSDTKALLIEKNSCLGATEEDMRKLKEQLLSYEEKISQLKEASKQLEERLWPLQDQVKECEAKRRQLSSGNDAEKQRLEEYQRKMDNVKSVVLLKQSEVDAKATEANKFGERPDNIRRVTDISNDIKEISRNINRIETDTANIDEMSKRHEELVEKYSSITEVMQPLYKAKKKLNNAVEMRKKHYKITESYFTVFMKHSFKKILQFRQFEGDIDINMTDKKLDLIVIPQQGSQGLTTTSNLSGGERSFSTVAFLYSLWQCMDFPFYFLDEFDVYMDKLNRTKVIDILLHHANSKPELQFVFLTPQDVSFISKKVSILRMQDPERFVA